MTLQHFTIADLQRALHDGELSAREIARQTLDDIARVNPQINAWTEVTAQRMLAEADSIDALRREKRPFCLLYTSDAADDPPWVDLGGRRLIKKKNSKKKKT